jgi:hypothetical protein
VPEQIRDTAGTPRRSMAQEVLANTPGESVRDVPEFSSQVVSRLVVEQPLASMAALSVKTVAGDRSRLPARIGRLACGLLGAAQPVAVQPIPDRIPVHTQLAGDLDERPRPFDHAVGQIRREISEAELAGALGQTLVGGAAALTGATDLR